MAVQHPFHHPPAKQGLLRRTLCDLYIGVQGAVVVVQRITGGQMLLSIAQGDEGHGQGPVVAAGLGAGARLRREAGAAGQPQGGEYQHQHAEQKGFHGRSLFNRGRQART